MKEVVRQESTIKKEARKLNDLAIRVSGFEHAYEKGMSTRDSDLIFQRFQDLLFRIDNLSGQNKKANVSTCER